MKITDTMEKTWEHLIKVGMTSEGTIGLMGNLFAESNIIPNRVEMFCLQKFREASKLCADATYTTFVEDNVISCTKFLHSLSNY